MFEELECTRGSRGTPDAVRVHSTEKQIVFNIGKEVCRQFGIANKSKLRMFYDPEEGLIRLIKDDKKGNYTVTRLSQNSETLKLQRWGLPGVSREKHLSEICEHKFVDNALEIVLPEWTTARDNSNPAPLATSSVTNVVRSVSPMSRPAMSVHSDEPIKPPDRAALMSGKR